MVVRAHCQDAARGFVWPHMVMDGRTVGDVLPVFEMVTSGDGVFLTDIIRARGWIMEDAAHP